MMETQTGLYRILLVEDSLTQALALRRLLETNNFAVLTANHGREALRVLAQAKIDLVLTDIEMPQMNGFELCKAIKSDERFQSIPVVLLSNLSDGQNILRGLAAQADYYLTKPCPSGYLVERLRAFLAESRTSLREEKDGLLELTIDGQKQFVTVTRRQMLTLLLSTYENSVQQNRELLQTQLELSQANQRLHEQQALLEKLATHDGLTGLKNSRKFREDFEEALRRGGVVSLLLVDVDRFKDFNDSFGHLAGDEALKTMAQILRASIRGSDLPARYGGEEFALILPSTGEGEARMVAERIRSNVEQAEWKLRKITVSIGIATSTPALNNTQALFAAADQALYASKKTGRNRVTSSSQLAGILSPKS